MQSPFMVVEGDSTLYRLLAWVEVLMVSNTCSHFRFGYIGYIRSITIILYLYIYVLYVKGYSSLVPLLLWGGVRGTIGCNNFPRKFGNCKDFLTGTRFCGMGRTYVRIVCFLADARIVAEWNRAVKCELCWRTVIHRVCGLRLPCNVCGVHCIYLTFCFSNFCGIRPNNWSSVLFLFSVGLSLVLKCSRQNLLGEIAQFGIET